MMEPVASKAAELPRQEQEAAELRAELHLMKTAGIIEVAVRNPSVAEYMAHWEGRTSDAEARIADITKWRDEWKDMATELKGLVEEWQARAEAAEALLKEAGTLAKIAIGAEKMMNGAAIYFAADGERDDAKKLTKVATIMGEHARALKSKIGVKDE